MLEEYKRRNVTVDKMSDSLLAQHIQCIDIIYRDLDVSVPQLRAMNKKCWGLNRNR